MSVRGSLWHGPPPLGLTLTRTVCDVLRVTVASLLTVILMTNMEYLTTVLHQLLVRHISRIARSKHPHLMLRRTETVMEKLLTNWISVCLYG